MLTQSLSAPAAAAADEPVQDTAAAGGLQVIASAPPTLNTQQHSCCGGILLDVTQASVDPAHVCYFPSRHPCALPFQRKCGKRMRLAWFWFGFAVLASAVCIAWLAHGECVRADGRAGASAMANLTSSVERVLLAMGGKVIER